MKRDLSRAKQRQVGSDLPDRWEMVAYDDLTGIDGDIERLLVAFQQRHGYTRDRANAELVRRLSFAA